MTERDADPRDPEILLKRARQDFRETMLEELIILQLFEELLFEDRDMSIEPYFRGSTQGIYAQSIQKFNDARHLEDHTKTHGRHLPILEVNYDDQPAKITASFAEKMIDLGYGSDQIYHICTLFQAAAQRFMQTIPPSLGHDPKLFTWYIHNDLRLTIQQIVLMSSQA